MEIILAIAVVGAVIFFGALISVGNERQRKAIDALHEQIARWTIHDLGLKRERLVRDVRVDDPIGWFSKLATRACGYNLNLQVIESFDEPPALMCLCENSNCNVVFSPFSRTEIRHMKRKKHNKLAEYADRNPLMNLPKRVAAYQFSVLNSNILFDLEVTLAWKELTGQRIEYMDRVWVYITFS